MFLQGLFHSEILDLKPVISEQQTRKNNRILLATNTHISDNNKWLSVTRISHQLRIQNFEMFMLQLSQNEKGTL